MYLSKQFLIIVTSISLIFIGYFNTCSCAANYNVGTQSAEPKSAKNNSSLQFPELAGTGGLDLDLNDKVLGIVNITRGLPSFAVQFGDFTFLQFALIFVVGGLLVGLAAVLAEGHFFRLYYSDLFDGHVGTYSSAYGAPPIYGAPNPPNEYGAPNPPSTYGEPNPPSTYGAPNPPSTYGAPNPPSMYGEPNPPSTYGAPNPPSTYGKPNPPSTYGKPNPPSTYGAPS